mgnify:CR=1 FL=1
MRSSWSPGARARTRQVTVIVSPPQASGISPRWARSFITLLGSAFALSILLTATTIGTSTNLLVNDQLKQHDLRPLGFFEIGMAGAPLAVAICGDPGPSTATSTT